MYTAVDAGIVANPEMVRSQFEGAAVFGTSIARTGEITATNGIIDQSNFNDYPVARMNDAPRARGCTDCRELSRSGRGWRAWSAAVCSRPMQRDLCGDGKTGTGAATDAQWILVTCVCSNHGAEAHTDS